MLLKRLHPLMRDIGLTGLTIVATLGTNLLVVAAFGRLLGAGALAQYLLVRRVSTWLIYGGQLGLGIGVSRYISRVTDDESAGVSYFLAALIASGAFIVFGAVLLNMRAGLVASLLFGDLHQAPLVFPMTLFVTAFVLYAMVYGYYRGRLQMKGANALQFCANAVPPLAAIAFVRKFRSVPILIAIMGVTLMLCSGVFALPIFSRINVQAIKGIKGRAKELLSFGLARVPGDLALGLLAAVGPMFAAHLVSISQVGYLLVGLSLLSMVEIGFTPLGIVLLAKTSQMLANNRTEEVRSALALLLIGVIEISVFACIQLEVFVDVLVKGWLGDKFLPAVPIIRIVLLSVPFDIIFVTSRSYIDAAVVTAFNARNVVLGLVTLLVLCSIAGMIGPRNLILNGLAIALVVAYAVIAALTLRTLRHLFNLTLKFSQCKIAILLGGALGGLSLGSRFWRPDIGILEFIIIEALISAIFVTSLFLLDSPWLSFGAQMIFGRSDSATGAAA